MIELWKEQTTARRCPYCKEEYDCGLKHCPGCGASNWDSEQARRTAPEFRRPLPELPGQKEHPPEQETPQPERRKKQKSQESRERDDNQHRRNKRRRGRRTPRVPEYANDTSRAIVFAAGLAVWVSAFVFVFAVLYDRLPVDSTNRIAVVLTSVVLPGWCLLFLLRSRKIQTAAKAGLGILLVLVILFGLYAVVF